MPLEGGFRCLELCLYSITELVFQTWSGPIWSVAVRVLWVFLSNYLLHSRRLFWHGTGAAGQSEQSAGNYINMKQHSWMRGNVNLLCSDTSQSSSLSLEGWSRTGSINFLRSDQSEEWQDWNTEIYRGWEERERRNVPLWICLRQVSSLDGVHCKLM